MSRDESPFEVVLDALLDERAFGLDELCRLAGVSPAWLQQRLHEGLIAAPPGLGDRRFDVRTLHRVRCMVRLERDFNAVPELAALVADLQDELAALRAELLRRGR